MVRGGFSLSFNPIPVVMLAMYGVSVGNPFSLLDDDEREANFASPVPEPTPAAVEVTVKENHHDGNRQRHLRRGDNDATQRPRRGERPDNEGNKQNRRPKREFDRHSGTGRDAEIKRQGKGARNWGSPPTDTKEAKVEETAVAASSSWDAPAPEAAGASWGVSWDAPTENVAEPIQTEAQFPEEPAPEPEPEELDLEEYLKSQASLRVEEDALLQIRKVARDESEKILVAAREEDASGLLSGLSEKKKKAKAKQATKKMASLNIAEFTQDQQKQQGGGGFRGGRRGGRGGSFGNRGGRFPRGGDSSQANRSQVDIADKLAFPSLA